MSARGSALTPRLRAAYTPRPTVRINAASRIRPGRRSTAPSHPAHAWSIAAEGEGVPENDENLFLVAVRATAKAARRDIPPQHVTQRSAIPIARGLGSSAAAIVGGVVAANALLGEPFDRRSLLRIATEVEGHADNVAAALYGALTVALPSDGGPVATRIAFPSAWRICLLIPTRRMKTEEARAVLQPHVSREDAVFNIAHGAALIAAVMRSDGALLSIAMTDRLHQTARSAIVPAMAELIACAREAGAFGAALSGAGPSVLAIAPARLAPRVVVALEETAAAHGAPGRGRVVRARAAGAQVYR